MTSSKETIARLVEICKEKSVNSVVFSPGSRNAPLIIAFDSDPEIKCFNIPDERVAGFFALGLSIQSGNPVVICCTSGSAALNYAPAISEAYYQKVSLIVLTADRPMEWIDQRAGQTIRQNDIFKNIIKKSFTLVQEAKEPDLLWYNDRLINEAIERASGANPGPVHINIPIKEPLYDQKSNVDQKPKLIGSLRVVTDLSISDQKDLKNRFQKHESVLIICGQHSPNDEWRRSIRSLSQLNNVIVFSEATSNVTGDNIITCIDRTIHATEDNTKYAPSLLITCGGSIISKKIRFLLRGMEIAEHWHIDPFDHFIDTYQALTLNVPISLPRFVEIIFSNNTLEPSPFKEHWISRNAQRRLLHEDYLESISWSDLQAVNDILGSLPEPCVLHMANSTSVRYVQLFDSIADVDYNCNRGVSGIDGCTSTASGFAHNSDKINVLITGDIAFFYDSNAFWHHHITNNLRVIVLNNSGGNIFRFIPGPDTTEQLEQHFEAHHETKADKLAETYGIRYLSATNRAELNDSLKELYNQNKSTILEVFTPRLQNDGVLKAYFNYLAENK